MAGTYRVKVKDGDYGYHEGSYGTKDYVLETSNLAEALRDFLEWADNGDGTDKVTFTFRPEKGDE